MMLLFVLIVALMNLCGFMFLFIAWMDARKDNRELRERMDFMETFPFLTIRSSRIIPVQTQPVSQLNVMN